jgi:hypothetical protein
MQQRTRAGVGMWDWKRRSFDGARLLRVIWLLENGSRARRSVAVGGWLDIFGVFGACTLGSLPVPTQIIESAERRPINDAIDSPL